MRSVDQAARAVSITVGPVLLHVCAIVIGGGTAFLPEVSRIVKARLEAIAGSKS